MKLFLIRHAESIYNKQRLLQGQTDCDLSENGIKCTKKASKTLSKDFDICYCSPLKRTKKTAEFLVPHLDIIYDDRLIERGFGDWEGTSIDDEKIFLLNNNVIPPNGETYEMLDKRVQDFLSMIKEKYSDKRILIITHSGVIYSFHRILGIEPKSIDNLEILTIEI